MTLTELDNYFNSFLKKENYPSDPSLNGIQIQNCEPDKKQIKKIAFAVDACEATALKAAEANADVLFVHHGLFWGGCQTITGAFYKRIAGFVKNDIALIGYHIPLDANSEVGNNYGMAKRLNLQNTEPFGNWRGMNIGVKGTLPSPLSLKEVAEKVLRDNSKTSILQFKQSDIIKTIGIISGGAGEDVDQAVEQGLDAYLTGEFAHEQFHYAEEMEINIIAGGHYETETVGVNLVREKVEKELGLETIFIDLPTGL